MNCGYCGGSFLPKMKSQKYCNPTCRNARRARCPTRKENMKAWRRKSDLKNKYGLSTEKYDKLIAANHGRCYLCDGFPFGNRALSVDHCHKTGRVRGMLCDICNRHVIRDRTLAYFKKCVEYLREPKVNGE